MTKYKSTRKNNATATQPFSFITSSIFQVKFPKGEVWGRPGIKINEKGYGDDNFDDDSDNHFDDDNNDYDDDGNNIDANNDDDNDDEIDLHLTSLLHKKYTTLLQMT